MFASIATDAFIAQTEEATVMTIEGTAFMIMTEVPGADVAFAERMRHAGNLDALQAARGFSGPLEWRH